MLRARRRVRKLRRNPGLASRHRQPPGLRPRMKPSSAKARLRPRPSIPRIPLFRRACGSWRRRRFSRCGRRRACRPGRPAAAAGGPHSGRIVNPAVHAGGRCRRPGFARVDFGGGDSGAFRPIPPGQPEPDQDADGNSQVTRDGDLGFSADVHARPADGGADASAAHGHAATCADGIGQGCARQSHAAGRPQAQSAQERFVGGRIAGRIGYNAEVAIVDGPTDANGITWWKVDNGKGLVGWSAEGVGGVKYLIPVGWAK